MSAVEAARAIAYAWMCARLARFHLRALIGPIANDNTVPA